MAICLINEFANAFNKPILILIAYLENLKNL